MTLVGTRHKDWLGFGEERVEGCHDLVMLTGQVLTVDGGLELS